ncbi:creatininase family protein [bacterium]|nr:creatininase family protein [bacterium]
MERELRIQFLRPEEIIKERRKNSLIYLPLGPLEWHGPHLPLGVDPLRAEIAALELAKEIGGIVLPTLFIGTERERSEDMLKNIGFKEDEYIVGMDFPGNSLKSLYFKEEVFALVLRDYLRLLIDEWKFKNIVIVNGHGGENHLAVIDRLKKEFEFTKKVKIIHIMPMLNFPNHKWSHATKEETETLMVYYPESVNLRKLPPKSTPLYNLKWAIVDDLTFRGRPTKDFTVRKEEDPRDSNVENGRKIFKKTIEELKKIIEESL